MEAQKRKQDIQLAIVEQKRLDNIETKKMKEELRQEPMNITVEDLADKMVKARRVRDEFKRMSLNRQVSVKSNSQTRESFFKRKAEAT